MASKIKVKTILELQSKNLSRNQIADLRGMSRNSVSQVIKIANELGIKYSDVADKDPETVYKLFFPDRHSTESIYGQPDYDYIHGELKRVGVTLSFCGRSIRLSAQQNQLFPWDTLDFAKVMQITQRPT